MTRRWTAGRVLAVPFVWLGMILSLLALGLEVAGTLVHMLADQIEEMGE